MVEDVTDTSTANADVVMLGATDSKLLLRHKQVKARLVRAVHRGYERSIDVRMRDPIESLESHAQISISV